MDSKDLGEVVAHYDAAREEHRLLTGMAGLELLRTQEILRRHLPPAPARIIDVGGGTGVHSEWLLDDGYEVHLVDLTPRHVEHARQMLGSRGLTAEVGDARQLDLPGGSADVVLLLGPLYHLVERDDRIAALREAARVVGPTGLVVAAGISRFASLFDGLAREFLFDDAFAAIAARDLATGHHDNPTNHPDWFTTAYFHRPDELAAEMHEAGIDTEAVVGVEGPAAWLPLDHRWSTPAGRARILQAARSVETEPSILGVSPHFLAIGRQRSAR